ncbi:single-stranded DNA-binding protein [Cytobacillus oceanisediminis]|uniref:single-stranded DNA-binding protein n=1 Tax=Cytobacillus oceanisediminis TaxID=665099 RepID=UPI001C250D58|nr:single-stranded DNA-binding protein [Cytobacillus oceanisediminis]MBU8732502.1 single-stranded DNA-binding protein [Cytobacillus oceanisediminis]
MHQTVTLVGRTTSNARLNYSYDEVPVANFDLAINRKGNPTKADFIPCVIWGDKAKMFSNKFGKGSLVLLEGELRSSLVPLEDSKPRNELKFEVVYFKQMETPRGLNSDQESISEEG